MSYQERTKEWEPDPEKALHIFISIVVKGAFDRGWMDPLAAEEVATRPEDNVGVPDMEEFLSEWVQNAERVWERRQYLRYVREIEMCLDLDTLAKVGQRIAQDATLLEADKTRLRAEWQTANKTLQQNTQ